MQITDTLNDAQYKELKNIYIKFFQEINFDLGYTDNNINGFSRKKVKDAKRKLNNSKFFFALDNEKIIGFIHGKICDDIGLICHAYVLKEYRNQMIFGRLYLSMVEWFKEQDVVTLEIEVNHNNPIKNSIERYNWQLYESFEDANVYQRKI